MNVHTSIEGFIEGAVVTIEFDEERSIRDEVDDRMVQFCFAKEGVVVDGYVGEDVAWSLGYAWEELWEAFK